MLMQLITKDWAIWIQKYDDKAISAFLIAWTLFYQDLLLNSEYIVLDAFHATGILTSGATQFEKITIQSMNSIFVNYSNNNRYADIYHYYTNKISALLVDRT